MDDRRELAQRRQALREDIDDIDAAIADADTPASYHRPKREKLETLRTERALRERELGDVEARLRFEEGG